MKVNQQPPPGTAPLEAGRAPDRAEVQGTRAAAPAAEPTRLPASSVELSEDAQLMRRAAEIARAAPDLRPDRVADLKKRIHEGTYQVDSAAVADRLVDEHLALDPNRSNS